MRLAEEHYDLQSGEARQIYELLRLHFLASNERENAWHVTMEEIPHERDGGRTIQIMIDVIPLAGSH